MARKSLADLLNGVTRFGRLTVLREAEPIPNPGNGVMRRALCRCDCGDERVYYIGNIKRGKSLSCGCLQAELARDRQITHGDGKRGEVAPEYRVWAHMIGRCENPNDTAFHNYGGRGISVCRAWRASYEAFLADVGRRPTDLHSIDRIDNNGNYEPSNVRWAVKAQQSRNVRYNRNLTYRGQTMCIKDAAEAFGLRRGTLEGRLDRGWSIEDALLTPARSER